MTSELPYSLGEFRPVVVVTDSAAALPVEIATAAGIIVTPMEITLQGKTYADGPDGIGDRFYDMLRETRAVPKTSAPRPSRWLEAMNKAAKHGESIVCITLAARLSAAFDSARVAVDMLKDSNPGLEVTVVDSETAAGSQALIALAAARAASADASHRQVIAAAQKALDGVRLIAYLDTLEYVWRSGRVPRVALWATSLLRMKPVMEFSRGKVGSIARPRSRPKAMERILTEMARDVGALPVHATVIHADAPGEAEELHARIEREFNTVELIVSQFAPFMGAHTGPGLVGVSFWAER